MMVGCGASGEGSKRGAIKNSRILTWAQERCHKRRIDGVMDSGETVEQCNKARNLTYH